MKKTWPIGSRHEQRPDSPDGPVLENRRPWSRVKFANGLARYAVAGGLACREGWIAAPTGNAPVVMLVVGNCRIEGRDLRNEELGTSASAALDKSSTHLGPEDVSTFRRAATVYKR